MAQNYGQDELPATRGELPKRGEKTTPTSCAPSSSHHAILVGMAVERFLACSQTKSLNGGKDFLSRTLSGVIHMSDFWDTSVAI